MLRNSNTWLGARLSNLARSKEIAADNGVPFLAWVLIILALALFVGFVMWWYRRYRAAKTTLVPTQPRMEEIELPVPTAVEMAASRPVEMPAIPFEVQASVPEPPPLDLGVIPTAMPEPLPMPEVQRVAVVSTPPADLTPPATPDNLVRIEGIGPKVASILQAGGITTFGQLAATEVSRLRELLVAANLRFMDPSSWPEQARLAAAGDWVGLESLTRELRGGRQV